MKKAIVIGSGFSGISSASFLAKAGWDVLVVEKNASPGGRARQLECDGFYFDMGPSWYWMPEVFEKYFEKLGVKRSDYYPLQRLDPSYKVYWANEAREIPADYEKLKALFESIEKGSAKNLDIFLKEAAYKYEVGINNLVYKPGQAISELADIKLLKGLLKLDVFTSMQKHVAGFFTDPRLKQLLEFPVLFLGALPSEIPALYSLMNYADIKLGTWYPRGGMHAVVTGMQKRAEELGVKFIFNTDVTKINIDEDQMIAKGISAFDSEGGSVEINADVIIATADYNFVEQQLLPESVRNYKKSYWDKRVMAPSCLLYYVGLNKKLHNVEHHSLFFDVDFQNHGQEIYKAPQWPTEPLFYVCAPSVTDDSISPTGSENLFFLIPTATGLEGDTGELRKKYFDKILARFEERTGENIKDSIIVFKTYGLTNFVDDYNAFKGNGYGLANTLMQTANLKPNCRNKKISNLFYAGQLTVPGPGVPPSLISGEIVAGLADRFCGKNKVEKRANIKQEIS